MQFVYVLIVRILSSTELPKNFECRKKLSDARAWDDILNIYNSLCKL